MGTGEGKGDHCLLSIWSPGKDHAKERFILFKARGIVSKIKVSAVWPIHITGKVVSTTEKEPVHTCLGRSVPIDLRHLGSPLPLDEALAAAALGFLDSV